jgi:hypothetical protein
VPTSGLAWLMFRPRRGNARDGPALAAGAEISGNGSYVEGLTDPQGIWVLISRPCRHSP